MLIFQKWREYVKGLHKLKMIEVKHVKDPIHKLEMIEVKHVKALHTVDKSNRNYLN